MDLLPHGEIQIMVEPELQLILVIQKYTQLYEPLPLSKLMDLLPLGVIEDMVETELQLIQGIQKYIQVGELLLP